MNNETNPYAPPIANLENTPTQNSGELAGRWQRLFAVLIDGLIGAAYGLPIAFLLGFFDYSKRGEQPPLYLALISGAIGFVLFVIVHGYFLKQNGQTLGKKALGIRIVSLDNSLPSLQTLLVQRYLPISLVSIIPFVGSFLPLIDGLFIFRDDKRCIHDLIAGTKVVKC